MKEEKPTKEIEEREEERGEEKKERKKRKAQRVTTRTLRETVSLTHCNRSDEMKTNSIDITLLKVTMKVM